MASVRQRTRDELSRKVRELRVARQWTQTELATKLGLSQSRLSEIERGAGSFTAEQFLEILRLFNVTTDHFVPTRSEPAVDLQNALARLGATHLQETADSVPSDRLRQADAVIREVLIEPSSPRWLTALGPVLIRNLSAVRLSRLAASLAELGLVHRLGWLIENTLAAVREDLPHADKASQKLYRRAEVELLPFLERLAAANDAGTERQTADVLDQAVRSVRTRLEVQTKSSPLARRWGIASELTVDDFVAALRSARAGH